MTPLLPGLHDRESVAVAPPGTWALDTIAISENPPPTSYPTSLNWITRINWGYGSAGTLPLPSVYEAFAQRVAQYVNGSSGCRRWIIGNEGNLRREWPDNQPIFPWNYAACYKLCWEAIHALPGHSQDEVLIAASGPWNDELKYAANPNGDWIAYFTDIISLCGSACDGYSIHAYTHQYDVSLVTSSARMDRPFQNRYYEFYTYRDYCEAIPHELRYLPVYITEANGNGPWQAVRLMPAMLQEIDSWNHSKLPKIQAVIFYRWPHYDQFYIEGRGDVIAEYQAAVALGYESPMDIPKPPTPPQPQPPDPPRPPTPTPPPLDWDERLTVRGCTRQPSLMPSDVAPYVRVGRWFDKTQAQGRVSVYVRLLDDQSKLVTGVPVTWFWSSGSETKLTERKSDPWLASQGLGAEYSLDFAMYEPAPSYGVKIEGDYRGDIINGCGLGSIEQPDYKIHTAYFFEWQLSSEGVTAPDPTPPIAPQVKRLVWPVVGPVTQHFGEPPAVFGQAGHNGIDIAVAEGTPVVAIADGVVMFTGNDAPGYGNYVRCYHPSISSHSFYAHLSEVDVQVGQPVKQGDTLGASGNTGNSTGPHLHFELRAGSKDAYYQGVTFGYTSGRYNPVDAYVVTGSPITPGAGR